jgi:hypothetical protein
LDTAGRVERFAKRFEKTGLETQKKDVKATKLAKGQVAPEKKKVKVLSSAPVKAKAKPTKGSGKAPEKAAAADKK